MQPIIDFAGFSLLCARHKELSNPAYKLRYNFFLYPPHLLHTKHKDSTSQGKPTETEVHHPVMVKQILRMLREKRKNCHAHKPAKCSS